MTDGEYMKVLDYIENLIITDPTPKKKYFNPDNKTYLQYKSTDSDVVIRVDQYKHYGYGYNGKIYTKGFDITIRSYGNKIKDKKRAKRIFSTNLARTDSVIKESLDIFSQMINEQKIEKTIESGQILKMKFLAERLGYENANVTKNSILLWTKITPVKIVANDKDKIYNITFDLVDTKNIKKVLEALESD